MWPVHRGTLSSLRNEIILLSLADKLEVTTVCGLLGEALPLYKRLAALPSNTNWLSTLEYIMKTTVNTAMEACVQARLEDSK